MATNRRLWMLFLLVSLLAAAPLWGQNSINLSGCVTQIGAGNTVTCSVNLTLGAGVSLDFLTFSASVTANGGAPAPTAVGFTSTVAGLSPINGPTSGGGFGSVSINSSGSLGSIHYTVPASATGGQSYTLAFTNAQGSLSGNNVAITSGAASTTAVIGILSITGPASPLPTGTINVAYPSTTVTATGGLTPYTFTQTGLPAGLNLSGAGVISGTPTVSGAFSVVVTVKDTNSPQGTAPQTFSLTINPALSISAPATLPVGAQGAAYPATQITATGGSGTGYTFSAPALPAPLGISAGGLITGTPTAPFSGNVVITVTDSNNATVTKTYALTISGPLTITGPATIPVATVNFPYPAITITGAGGTGAYTWSAAGLPTGLSINPATGVISGTPTAGGGTAPTVTVTLNDASGLNTQTKNYTLTINPALSISGPATLPSDTVSIPYPATTITATGGSGTYTFTSTALPAVLNLSAGGSITGTPTAAGTTSVTVTVTDSNNVTATKIYSITITPAVSITGPAALPGVTVGIPYSVTVTATGGNGTYTWSATGLPGGLGIAPGTGVISGTAGSAAGSPFAVTVTATDGTTTANQNYSLAVNAPPSITGPASLPIATVNSLYTATTVTATGGTLPLAWSQTGLPAGMTINAATGVIGGTPTSNAGSPLTVTVTVKDANLATASQGFTLQVNPALVITAPATLPVGTPGVVYPATTVTASGGNGGPYTFSQTGLPAPLTLNSTTGVISGTPTNNTGSPYTVAITVTDGIGVKTTRTYSLFINPPLSITGPASLPAGTIGSGYSTTILATGGSGSYTWSATGLPTGLSINSSGVIIGTPATSVGTPFTVVVTVTDSSSSTAKITYSLSIAALPLTFTTFSLPPGIINVPYPATTITAKGGVGDYSFTASGLPPGLSMDANGQITGTPTSTTGSPFTVTVTVKDSSSTNTTTYNLPISGTLTVAAPATLPGGNLGSPYVSTTVTAGGGLSPYTWAATGLPAGMTINIATGVIGGTPTTATGSPFTVVVTVTDGTGAKANKTYTLTINASFSVTGPASLPSGTVGAAYTSTTVTAAGGSGSLTWSATGLPSGLTINSATGAISGTPNTATGSPFTVVVTATDSTGATATKSYSLIINPSATAVPSISSVSNALGGQAVAAPNTYLGVYGTNFEPTGFTDDWSKTVKNGVLPTTLDGVGVSIGGVAAYVYYVSATQINVLTPTNLGLGPVQVTVTTPAGTSAPFTINSQQYSPAFNPVPNGQPLATHLDYSLAVKPGTYPATTTIAAKPGEPIILWGTGFGPTTPAAPNGTAIPATGTYLTSTPVTISLAGAPATVINNAAVLTNGLAGLFQITFTVPLSLANGDYPITATVNGVTTPVATLTVHN